LNRRNSNKILILVPILLVVGMFAVGILVGYLNYTKMGVKPAVFKPWAYHLIDGENYFIVGRYSKYDKGGSEIFYYLVEGKKVPVRITGKSPFEEMDQRVFRGNTYLVKGYINEEMTDFVGIDVLVAESWDIIGPINRNENVTNRFFAPVWYIDKYDVISGAYVVEDPYIRGVNYWEEAWLRHIWEDEYIILTSDFVDGEIQWYRILEGVETPITLKGNTPEQYYEENVSREEMKIVFDDKENRFIARGSFREDKSDFFLEEWRIINKENWEYNQLEY